MSTEFRIKVIEHAKQAVHRGNRVTSEEGARQYLVLPFFKLLGYDPLDPDEIIPESAASFADKFKNKVDYAIHHEGVPVIAVECKKTGSLNEGHRGELKGYFNAVPTTRLGILTDGLHFELYSDTNADNMMDDEPYIAFDLTAISQGELDDNELDALIRLSKGTFDPADVGANAKRKIFITRYVEVLEQQLQEPTEEFVKVLMDAAGIEGRRTIRLVEEHLPIVNDAIATYFDKRILERIGFASRQDLVRKPTATAAPAPIEVLPEPEAPADGIITTETELMVFDHVRSRLLFLIEDEAHYDRVQSLAYRDYKTVFSVWYKQERRGKLFNFREGPNGEYRFEFPEEPEVIETTDLYAVDEPLLASFLKRVEELG